MIILDKEISISYNQFFFLPKIKKMPNNIYFFLNKNGGKGNALDWFEIYCEFITDLEIGPIVTAENSEKLKEHIENNIEGILQSHSVAIFGGDGTIYQYINNIINQLQRGNDTFIHFPPTLIFPCGSGNSLAKNLNMTSLRTNMRSNITTMNIRNVPIWRVSDNISQDAYFLTSLTYGIITDIDIKTEWMRKIGDTRYLLGSFWSILFPKYYPIHCELTRENNQKVYINNNVLLFCVVSSSYLTEQLKVSALTNIEEQNLELLYVDQKLTLRERYQLVRDIFSNNIYQNKYVKSHRVKSFRLELPDSSHCLIDGEKIKQRCFSVSPSKHYLPCYAKSNNH
jgi:sphingosine kinase